MQTLYGYIQPLVLKWVVLVKYLRLSERLSPESATDQIFTDEAAKSQYQRMRVTVFVNTILTFNDIFFYFRYFAFIYQATTLKYKAFLSSSLSISILMGSEGMHHIRPNCQAPFFCDFFNFARISIFFIFVKVFSGGITKSPRMLHITTAIDKQYHTGSPCLYVPRNGFTNQAGLSMMITQFLSNTSIPGQ